MKTRKHRVAFFEKANAAVEVRGIGGLTLFKVGGDLGFLWLGFLQFCGRNDAQWCEVLGFKDIEKPGSIKDLEVVVGLKQKVVNVQEAVFFLFALLLDHQIDHWYRISKSGKQVVEASCAQFLYKHLVGGLLQLAAELLHTITATSHAPIRQAGAIFLHEINDFCWQRHQTNDDLEVITLLPFAIEL